MGFWQNIGKKINRWLTGGGNKSTPKATPPAPRIVYNNPNARNQTVSSNTGNTGINKRAFLNSLKSGSSDSRSDKKEENRVQDAFKANKYSYKSMAAVDDVKKSINTAKKMLDEERERSGKVSKDALRNSLKKREEEIAEFHRRTGNKYNPKTGNKEHDKQAAQLIKGGFNSSDIEAEKMAVEYHPQAYSATRGALSGVTWGLSDVALRNRKGERAEAEKYYQEHKDKTAEMLGEIGGTFVSFGGAGKAAAKPAAKIVSSELGEKAVGKLAANRLTRATAKRAIKKAGGEVTEDLIKSVARRKAEDVAKGLTTSALIDSTAGNILNATQASREHEVGSKEWWKDFGKYAAINAGISGAVSLAPVALGGKKIASEEALSLMQRRNQARSLVKQADIVNDAFNKTLAETPFPENVSIRELVEPRTQARAAKNAFEADAERLAAGTPTRVAERRGRLIGEGIEDRIANIDAERVAKANDNAKSIAESFSKSRKKVNARILEENPNLAEIYEADKKGQWVFGRDKDGNLFVGNPKNGKSFGELTQENFDKAKQAFDSENLDPFISKAKGAKAEAENLKVQETAWENKRNNILDYIGQSGDDAAEGVKPAAESLEPKAIPSLREKEYTVQVTYESGTKRKVKVRGTSETEALDKALAGKNRKSVKILDEAEIAVDGAKPAAEEVAPAVETTAKGTKPAAQNLKPKTEAQPKFEPQSAEDIRANSGVKHEQKTNKEKSSEFWSSFRTKFVDSLDAFEQENKQFLKSDPERWAKNNGAIDKLRRHQSLAARSIGEGQIGWNGQVLKNLDGTDAKSLKAIYDGLDKEREELFETYLLLKHAPDRADAGKPIYAGKFSTREACEEEANKILANNKDFEKRAEELYQYTRNELQNRADAGLIPQEVVDDWFEKYPHYVPTGRAGEFKPDEDIWEVAHELARNGNTIKAGDIKAASEKISDAPIRSIKEQLSEATTRNWRDMSMNNLFNRMFGDKVSAKLAAEADGGLATVLDNTVNLKSNNGKYFAEVFVGGEPHRVEIEKRFYDGIKDLLKNGRVGDAIDFASDVAAMPSSLFKNVVTSWNPIFMVKNGMRDFPEAVINSRNTKEFIECMDAARRDLYGVEGGGMWTRALRNQGVSQANFVNLEEALTKERTFIGKGANKFATLQESVETYPRLVEFMGTIKKLNDGVLPETLENIPMEWLDVAAANAADVTVNFGRSGSIGKMLNRGFVPFFNPSIQGFDKFIRNLSQQPSTAKLLGTVTKALALGAGVQAVNNLMLDDNPYYQQIAAREKATNIIIACPFKIEDGKIHRVSENEANVFIKIPKSRFAAAYSLPMVNLGNENKMGWAEMIKVAGDQVAPVNPIESNILSAFALASKGEQGETWYGTPIVPEALLDKMPSEQYDANTSWFGKTLGKATAGLPEELQISPKKADYVLDATTGVFGDFLLPMATPSRQGGGGFVNKYITHPMGNVAKRAFSIDATTQNDLSTRFYGARDKAEKMKNSANGGEAEEKEFKRLTSYSTEIAGINQAIRHLQDSDRETKQADIYELQKIRNQMMQDALDGKRVPSSQKTLDAVQKYVGTTFAIDNFGSSADQKAMKLYGKAKYGNISDKEMKKAIDADAGFYKGVRSIGDLENKIEKEGFKSNTVLSKAVALASADADDDLFGAYKATKQSRTESANKMERARTYIKNGGSMDEYVQLEKVRRTHGKLPDEEADAAIAKAEDQVAKGEITLAEYYDKEDSAKYNANLSYIGLATSLAQANAPERGYRLYDISDNNIRKGTNLAAMGFTARDIKDMKKAMDTNGNGYPSKQEVIDYVANSGVEDKATLFDALYPYQTKSNPFGSVTNYSRAQAAQAGKSNGIDQFGGDTKDFTLNTDDGTSGYGYGYSGRRYGRSGRRRSGGSSKTATPPEIKQSSYKATKQTYKSLAETLKTSPQTNSTKMASVKVEPPTVKFKKYEV